jgi:hypothetical protein
MNHGIQQSGPAWELFLRIRKYMENTKTISKEVIDGFEVEFTALGLARKS